MVTGDACLVGEPLEPNEEEEIDVQGKQVVPKVDILVVDNNPTHEHSKGVCSVADVDCLDDGLRI